ncbi:MAG TPA: MauE/DoxX family redox-associated membrane protein [Bacteroidota bacterium]
MFRPSFPSDVARLVLGLVLTAASVSKIFAFHPFAMSLSSLAHVPEYLANPAAAGLIALECGTGLLLLSGKSIRIAASAALFLFVAFTVLLSGAIVRGVDVPCNCFGSLGPRLPAREQALLDLLLAVVAFFLIKAASASALRKFSLRTGIAALAALLWGSALIVWPHPETGTGGETPVPAAFLNEASVNASGGPAVILLADFDDFGCQLCLDDFLAFCDSLNGAKFRLTVSVRLFARRDSARSGPAQARMLEGWAAGNRYLFPVSVDSESLFERSGVGKTSAIVLGVDGHLVDIAHFPTGSLKRNELLRAIGN